MPAAANSGKAGSAAAAVSSVGATPLEIRIYGTVPLPVPIHPIDRWSLPNRIAKTTRRLHMNAADASLPMHRLRGKCLALTP